MKHYQIIKDILLPELSIGDLVRLNEDLNLHIGIGVVEDIKLNFDDVYDISYILDKINEYRIGVKFNLENDGFFPSKPQVLVLWTGQRLSKSNSMWMYTSEITLLHKVKPGVE